MAVAITLRWFLSISYRLYYGSFLQINIRHRRNIGLHHVSKFHKCHPYLPVRNIFNVLCNHRPNMPQTYLCHASFETFHWRRQQSYGQNPLSTAIKSSHYFLTYSIYPWCTKYGPHFQLLHFFRLLVRTARQSPLSQIIVQFQSYFSLPQQFPSYLLVSSPKFV